eukprot:12212583-Prorocentrum_lima.AAC.1
MTSSLVGSEMCIRDSQKASPEVAGVHHTSTPCPPSVPTRKHCPCSLSVSYTHLTLPTICSV